MRPCDWAIGREIAFVAVFVALGLAQIPCIVIRIQEVEDTGPSAVIGSVVSLIDVGSVRRGTHIGIEISRDARIDGEAVAGT